ncbi:F-box only protein 40-like isoform X2 [Vanacampus margaritifer]
MSAPRRVSSRGRQHAHCESCYSGRCRARAEAGVCCALVACHLHCGARFHLCKEEGHLLLCPNIRVPCLNAAYGCPALLPRARLASHLRTCPASVVVCGAEWNRWPEDRMCLRPDSPGEEEEEEEEEDEGQPEALDVALARVDQEKLFARLRMDTLYPEMTQQQEEEKETREEHLRDTAQQQQHKGFHTSRPEDSNPREAAVTMATAQAAAKKPSPPNEDKPKMSEATSGPEKVDRAPAEAKRNDPEASSEKTEGGPRGVEKKAGLEGGAEGVSSPSLLDMSKSGLAPWQDGVLERLGQELSPQEYNMYVVHHGRMLLAFGHIQACTPRDKDFVYGSLDPIPVQTLHSFKVPTSYRYRSRAQLYDTGVRAPSQHRSVDTSDLPVDPDRLYDDEVLDTLLGYAEREARGHKISEWKATDGRYVDVGTQTHRFRSAPFKRGSTVAEVTGDRSQKRLHLTLQDESASGRHNRACCAFNFLCGHSFLRREFAAHVRNVHCDIQSGLSGWFEQRCPLAYLGCTYTWRRFRPAGNTPAVTVTYHQRLSSFSLRPSEDAGPPPCSDTFDALSSLPWELLCHLASFLDALSLSQLALVSRLMRQVCATLLPTRGTVSLRWERTARPGRRVRWTSEPVWQFSPALSSVSSWRMSDASAMADHLKVCPFYETCLPDGPVALVGAMREEIRPETPSLVQRFAAVSQ